jgi:hypothetical protein
MAARPQVAGDTPAVVDGAIVAFLDPGGVERRVPLAAAVEVAFEDARPAREFPSYQGQRNYPGLWWSATSGRHVGAVFAQPQPLLAGAEQVGDPIRVLPVIYHLLWAGRLRTDLTVLLAEHCLVRAAEAAAEGSR